MSELIEKVRKAGQRMVPVPGRGDMEPRDEYRIVVNAVERDAIVEALERGWQPIETAPKDGTAILLTDARVLDWTQVAYWDGRPGEYVWARDDADTLWHKDSFTHWMRLPSPPVGK